MDVDLNELVYLCKSERDLSMVIHKLWDIRHYSCARKMIRSALGGMRVVRTRIEDVKRELSW